MTFYSFVIHSILYTYLLVVSGIALFFKQRQELFPEELQEIKNGAKEYMK